MPILPTSCMGAARRIFSASAGDQPFARASISESNPLRRMCMLVSTSRQEEAATSR